MAISSAGVGSGLNVQSIVSQLVAVEQQPVRLMQAKGSTLQTKMSAFSQVKSGLAALQDAASALTSASTWSALTLTSGNASAFTGTVTSTAQAGSHTIEVKKLVSAQAIKTGSFAPDATIGASGDLRFFTGTNQGDISFSSAGLADTVSVAAGDKLADVVSKINAKSSTLGVTASVVTVGSQQQLVIRGNTAGAAHAFQIDADTGLEKLRFMPKQVNFTALPVPPSVPAATSSNDMTVGMNASDAEVSVDGITVTSSTNTVSDALSGVTLNLLALTSTPAQMSVDKDKASMKAKIQAFQDAYNKLYADLKTQTAYNAATKTGGPLLGDNTATSLQSMLRTLVGGSGPASSTIKRLSDLGLEIQSDGSLKTNSTKLDSALQDPSNVKAFFAASTGTASEKGIAKRVYDFAFGALAIGGAVSSHSAAFQKSIDQNNKTIDRMNIHIEAYQKQLLAQYNALDTNMAKLSSLSSYVSQQITAWNKSS